MYFLHNISLSSLARGLATTVPGKADCFANGDLKHYTSYNSTLENAAFGTQAQVGVRAGALVQFAGNSQEVHGKRVESASHGSPLPIDILRSRRSLVFKVENLSRLLAARGEVNPLTPCALLRLCTLFFRMASLECHHF